jgi:hypothetical protein
MLVIFGNFLRTRGKRLDPKPTWDLALGTARLPFLDYGDFEGRR